MIRFRQLTLHVVYFLNVLLIFLLLVEDKVHVPLILQVTGRMHPLVLHFPLVLLFVGIILEWLTKQKGFRHPAALSITSYVFYLFAVTAAITALLFFGTARDDVQRDAPVEAVDVTPGVRARCALLHAVGALWPLFPRDPLADIGWAMEECRACLLTPAQEAHHLDIHQRHFVEVQHYPGSIALHICLQGLQMRRLQVADQPECRVMLVSLSFNLACHLHCLFPVIGAGMTVDE